VSGLPVPEPAITSETEAFWAATGRHELVLAHCDECDAVVWYPRNFCPVCGHIGTTLVPAAGTGVVYACSVVYRGLGPWADAAPYVLAYVELDEGPRVLTNIVECDPETVAPGQRVEVVFDDTGAGNALYRFRPLA
jgi:uncharacterized protein